MSSANLKRFLNKVAIPHFKKRAGDKGQRKNIEERKGQIFVVSEDVFKKEFIGAGLTLGLPEKLLEEKWTLALKRTIKVLKSVPVDKLGKNYKESKARYNELKKEINSPKFKARIKQASKEQGKLHYFIIRDYQQMVDQKKPSGKFNKTLVKLYEELGADAEKAKYAIGGSTNVQREQGLNKGNYDTVTGFQLGHGEYGRAVSGLTAKEIKEKAQRSKKLSTADKDKIYNVFAEVDDALKISIDHEFIFTPSGKLKKDYVLILSLQSAGENLKDAKKEKTAFEKLEKDLKKLTLDPSSTRLRDAIDTFLMHKLTRSKYVKTNRRDTKDRFKEKSRANSNTKFQRRTNTNIVKMSSLMTRAQAKKLSLTKKKKPAINKQASLLAYLNEINKKLPEAVEKNMVPPRLESRTGRFAQSVKAVNVTATKQGYPSIGYTYQKNPYQVFEVGRGQVPWSSPERDPKNLIDKSLREVAAELALGRFYTRRL